MRITHCQKGASIYGNLLIAIDLRIHVTPVRTVATPVVANFLKRTPPPPPPKVPPVFDVVNTETYA